MTRQQKLGIVSAVLSFAVALAAQQLPVEIKLTVKRNGQTVPNPDRITFSAGSRSLNANVRNGKFDVPAEISQAKNWNLILVVKGEHITVKNLSKANLAYEDWTVLLANRHFNEDYASEVPKDADIRSSCLLVFDSQHIDPGMVVFQTHCRSRSPIPDTQ